MVAIHQTTLDLSVFQTQNAQVPGDYRVDIMFNGRYLDTSTTKFVANNRASSDNREPALVPCLSLKSTRGIWRKDKSLSRVSRRIKTAVQTFLGHS
ncbi:FimD/PapC N-terminal domain-containing protein [Klebsiella pneumoniae]|nr:FimD/PapC N-terminal domain-containing protein [Klebsiella pneumoniae]